jgi:hypothetical protein
VDNYFFKGEGSTTFCEQKVAKKLLAFPSRDLAAPSALRSKVFCFFCLQKKRLLNFLAAKHAP